ncbi:unnamed protein product, partial [Cyprideis torosa]
MQVAQLKPEIPINDTSNPRPSKWTNAPPKSSAPGTRSHKSAAATPKAFPPDTGLLGVDEGAYWSQMQAGVDWQEDVINGLIKSVVFGFIVTWIAVFEGYDTMPTSEGVSRATTRTVVHSSLAVLGMDFILTGQASTYRVELYFDNIGGLKVRSPVTVSGVRIGRVAAITYDSTQYRAKVTLDIDSQYNFLSTDTQASIYTAGLLGEQYVALEPGAEDAVLKNGATIRHTQSAMVLEELIDAPDKVLSERADVILTSLKRDSGVIRNNPEKMRALVNEQLLPLIDFESM